MLDGSQDRRLRKHVSSSPDRSTTFRLPSLFGAGRCDSNGSLCRPRQKSSVDVLRGQCVAHADKVLEPRCGLIGNGQDMVAPQANRRLPRESQTQPGSMGPDLKKIPPQKRQGALEPGRCSAGVRLTLFDPWSHHARPVRDRRSVPLCAPLSKRCSFGLSAFRAGNGDPSQARGGGQKINSRLRNCPMELFADKLCLRPN